MQLFDTSFVILKIFDYPLSLAELLGTLFGLWSVILAARGKVSNYPIGLINIIFFFVVFYQVQLYSDMFLQVYFFIISIYGWWKWMHPKEDEAKGNNELKITIFSLKTDFSIVVIVAVGVVAFGTLVKNMHLLLPAVFQYPAAFPYYDSFVAVASVVAMYLLAKKKLESWALWITVDAFCIVLYYLKGIKLMSLEYLIFFFIATYGFIRWQQEYKGYSISKESLKSK
jgi:nicotinamide mononucleotide transporter